MLPRAQATRGAWASTQQALQGARGGMPGPLSPTVPLVASPTHCSRTGCFTIVQVLEVEVGDQILVLSDDYKIKKK